jgi:hypothetical protein
MADLQGSVKDAIGDKPSRRDAGAPSQSDCGTSVRKLFSSRGLFFSWTVRNLRYQRG